MNHLLGVESTLMMNTDTQKVDYVLQIEITQDVYDWLDNHDIEYTEEREKVFLVNNIRYVYLGPKIELTMPMATEGQA